MIDTHSHLLPGLDDGSASFEQSLAMAREAFKSGVTAVLCTPHLRDPGDRAASRAPAVLEELRLLLGKERLPLTLRLGYELAFSLVTELRPAELRRYTLGADGRFLLVEIPHSSWPPFAEQVLHSLSLEGMVPILAHPERNERIQKDRAILPRLLSLGAYAQGTTASLTGLFGKAARDCLMRQLAAGEVSLLASDAHYGRRATWALPGGVNGLTTGMPSLDLGLLATENPGLILRGQLPRPAAPAPALSTWGRLLKRATARKSGEEW